MKPVNSEIKFTFDNQTIFLTGGTGFLGKVLIEKVLRECENVGKIYMLVRSKKGKSTEERFKEIFEQPCFEVLKSKDATVLEKVSLIEGDCQEPSLGLNEKNLQILKSEVNYVIHVAANVRFDQTLKEAVYNVRATRDLLQICKEMTNLKSFVFVSTAFSNCINSHIKEEVYKPPMDPQLLLNMVDGLDDNTLVKITPILLGKWPNTYVYTKSVSEYLVDSAAKCFPAAIVRPAIIMNSIKEPNPGWTDNVYGAIGMVVGAGFGVIRSFRAKVDSLAYIVPVDYVGNCVLAAIWKTIKEKKSSAVVFNYVGFNGKPLTWNKFDTISRVNYWSNAPRDLIWYNTFKLRENKLWHNICTFLLHTIPAYIIDAILFCLRKPTMAVKMYAKVDKVLTMTSAFTTVHWHFDEDNVGNLWNELNEEDKRLFNFSMGELQWDDYLRECILGMKRYLVKEPPGVTTATRAKMIIFMIAHYFIVVIFWYLIYKFIAFALNM